MPSCSHRQRLRLSYISVPEAAHDTIQLRHTVQGLARHHSALRQQARQKPRRVGPKSEPKATATPGGDGEDAENSKPKRVRTGCLTCRERHLKCDEAWPNCLNCRKSNRECKRGIKLNFIDTWVDRPTHLVTAFGTSRWRVEFLDESREIAAEYVGTTHKYPPLEQEVPLGLQQDQLLAYNFPGSVPAAPELAAASLPQRGDIYALQAQPEISNIFEVQTAKQQNTNFYSAPQAPNSSSSMHSSYAPQIHDPQMTSTFSGQSSDGIDEKRDFLNTAEETLFMQVFVEEVGLWMDSMDPLKHFSRLLPFHALSEPMLLHAFLACGAKHLTLVNPAYSVEKALHHYDTATRYLLKNLQNPNRDTVICATTAVILNVYEVMSERPMQRMNHIAGARALIKECGWSARASGIGAACFWLNVGLEVMSCLHFNWQVAWDPDDWGIDLNLTREVHNGMEESWTHKMLYITGKICNLRATAPRDVLPDATAEQARRQQRYNEWTRLKAMADTWNDCIPRTMHPMAYVYPANTGSKSAFPEVWLVKRTTIVARLFYHTAMLLLSQINPFMSVQTSEEMMDMQRRHSQMTCGIVAHVKDRQV
ncbi:hypothetical protein AMS68_004873 [Peltaster fructicola]|uniref:Zn(2)-C6 fungal-type domain-containing protein n=1 Tax=Peltaster fructicola TaxID=286661 RepID=A0A6H0XXE9_9PEZI|nr:hypothetical protein AMS68_004873 [Peltaster fructicola]